MVLSKNLVSHLMRYTPSTQNAFSVELQSFYRHLVLNDVIYAPLGMFVLSRGLIMTVRNFFELIFLMLTKFFQSNLGNVQSKISCFNLVALATRQIEECQQLTTFDSSN